MQQLLVFFVTLCKFKEIFNVTFFMQNQKNKALKK